MTPRGGKRPGVGRPPTPPEIKPKIRAIKFTDAEWALVKSKAENQELSISELIRRSVLKMNYNIITDAPNKDAVGVKFDSFESRPGADVVGEGWVYVTEYIGEKKTAGWGYCTDSNCDCPGSTTYWSE